VEENTAPSLKSQKIPLVVLGVILGLGILSLVGMVAFSLGRRQISGPEVTPSPTVTPQATESLTPTPTGIPTYRPTVSTTPLPTAPSTPEPTLTPSPTPTPTPVPQADLSISNFAFDHPPKKGEAFTAQITIKNGGEVASGPFWWEWKATWAITACRQRISDGIAAHGERLVTCTYTYSGWANYETKAIVDADNEVTESNETNNTYIQNVIPIH